jgi:hypothetical protein
MAALLSKGAPPIVNLNSTCLTMSFFVAQEVGLKHLLTEAWTEDDHYLHQFDEFEETEDTECLCDAEELKTRFMNAQKRGWFRGLVEWPNF